VYETEIIDDISVTKIKKAIVCRLIQNGNNCPVISSLLFNELYQQNE